MPVSSPPAVAGSSTRIVCPRAATSVAKPPRQRGHDLERHQPRPPRPGSARRPPRAPPRRASQPWRGGHRAPAVAQPRGERRASAAARTSASASAPCVAARAPCSALSPSARKVAEDVEVRDDRGQPGGQRLEHREAEALLRRGQGEEVGGAVEALELGVGHRAEHAHRAVEVELLAQRVEAVDLVAVVEQRRAAGHEQDGAALGQRARGRRRRRRSSVSDPLRGSMPPTVRIASSVAEAGRVARGGALAGVARRAEALGVDAVGDELGLDAELVAQPRDPRRRDARATRSGAAIERSWQAMSDGERKSSTWWTVRTTASTTPSSRSVERRVGRDAVLGVDDVEAAVAQRLAQAVGVGVDQRADALVEGRVGRRRGRRRAPAPAARGRSRSPGGPIANSSTSWPRSASAPATDERVHDAAARAHGVGEHRDPQRDSALARAAARRRRWTARRSRPRRAASPPGARRPAGRRRCRTRAPPPRRRSATRATAPAPARAAGSACAPWPQTTSSSTQPCARRRPRASSSSRRDAEVDHRVRAALRVALGPEVEDHVAVAVDRLGLGRHRRRAAARARRTPRGRASRRRTGRGRAPAPRAARVAVVVGAARRRAGRGERRGLERRVHLPAVDARRPSPRARRRRACPSGTAPASASTRLGRLGHEQQRLGLRRRAASIARPWRTIDPADLGRQVAPADADDVRHAAAGGVDQAGDLLRAGARRGDDARPARGARRWRSRGRRRPSIAVPHSGPITSSPRSAAAALERDLVLDRRRGRRRGRRAGRASARGAPRASRTRPAPRRARRWRRVEPRRSVRGAAPGRRRRRAPRAAAGEQPLRPRPATASPRPSSPSTAMTTSPGPASALGARAPPARSRLAGVPIATSHAAHAVAARAAPRAMPISRTLSA